MSAVVDVEAPGSAVESVTIIAGSGGVSIAVAMADATRDDTACVTVGVVVGVVRISVVVMRRVVVGGESGGTKIWRGTSPAGIFPFFVRRGEAVVAVRLSSTGGSRPNVRSA